MNKFSKTILIALSAFSFAGFLFLPSFVSANGLLNIVFEQKPLFQETNFLPGQSITRWIEVENKSTETQPIGVEVINYSSCASNCFSEQLELAISINSTNIYTDSLDDFFKAGEIKLSDLASRAKTKYFFAVTFLPQSGNQYQEKTVNFDFKIGSLGKESIGGEIGGGGNGSFFITGLEIFNETILDIGVNEVTITWNTNKPATSRVIYSSEFQPRILQLDNPPNYGYYSSTVENPVLTTNHQMVITGLASGTTYYFRCVSRGSLAVSKELKFTTVGVKGEETVFEPPIEPPSFVPDVLGEEIEELKEKISPKEDFVGEPEEEPDFEEELRDYFGVLPAAISDLFNLENPCWILFLALLLLIAFVLIYSTKQKRKKKWISYLFIAFLLVLYCIICRVNCWPLILITIILLVLSFIHKK